MAANKLTPAQRDKVLEEIATRYLRRERQADIGLALDLSQPQVSYYLRKLRAEWRQSASRVIDEAQAEELAKIDALEAEYWREYARSQKPGRRFMRTVETQTVAPDAPKAGKDASAPQAGLILTKTQTVRTRILQ